MQLRELNKIIHNIANPFYWIGLVLFFVTSCERTVVFDVDTQENKIVLNCLFGPGSDAQATASLSIDPLATSNKIQYIDDAVISLYKNEVYIGDFTYGGDFYSLDDDLIDAHPFDKFRIEASAPGREKITAETTIPDAIEITDLVIVDTTYETIFYSSFDSLGNLIIVDSIVPFIKFELSFDDLPGQDYYSLEVLYEDAFSSTYTCFTTSDAVFVLNTEFGGGSEETTVCGETDFSDLTFDGTTKTIQLSLLLLDTEFTTDPKFVFKLRHLSDEYYKYLTSSELQFSTDDDPFAEPVVVYSNIENGFGIFAGYAISTVVIEL